MADATDVISCARTTAATAGSAVEADASGGRHARPERHHDFVIDATGGDDGDDGSPARPWASFSPLRSAARTFGENDSVHVLVRAGTYEGAQHLMLRADAAAFSITIDFEQGSLMEAPRGSSRGPNAFAARGEATIILNGNGLTIKGYDGFNGGAYANALGAFDNATLVARDITIEDSGDGLSLHHNSSGYFYDISASDSRKYAVAHVGASKSYHENVVLFGSEAAVGGIVNISPGAAAEFVRTAFLPASSGASVNLRSATVSQSVVGCLNHPVSLRTDPDAVLTRTFLNVAADQKHVAGSWFENFGSVSLRQSIGDSRLLVERGIFAFPKDTQGEANFLYVDDKSRASPLTVRDTVFIGYPDGEPVFESDSTAAVTA